MHVMCSRLVKHAICRSAQACWQRCNARHNFCSSVHVPTINRLHSPGAVMRSIGMASKIRCFSIHSMIHDIAIKIYSGGQVIWTRAQEMQHIDPRCNTGRLCQVNCLDINMTYAVFSRQHTSLRVLFARALSACCST
jgi:hypothetical protein